jgi:hypothetical protein
VQFDEPDERACTFAHVNLVAVVVRALVCIGGALRDTGGHVVGRVAAARRG